FFTGFIAGTLFCALSDSFITLLAARIFTGIFGGVTGSITMTIVSDLFTPNQRGSAMSIVQMAFATSQILGIPSGLFIANNLGWHYTFFLIVVLSVLIVFVIILKLKPINEHLKMRSDKNPLLHWWHTIKNKRHQTGFSATVILGMGMMLQPFISIFLINSIHLTNAQVPVIFMVTGAAAFFIMPLVGRLSDKFDRFKIFCFGSIAAMIVVPVYTHLPVVPLWVVLIMNVTMFAVIMSRMGPFQALNSMIPQPADRGAYMSISSSLGQMSGGLGIVIAGSIVSQPTPQSPLENFDVLGYVVVGFCAVAVVMVYRVSQMVKNTIYP
ncbi:MAG: MFS transporter, partial [Bacteroidia bacterium]